MKKNVLLLLVLISCFCLFASTSWSTDVRVSAGGAFCVPTSDYLKVDNAPVRTSFLFSADAVVFDIKFDSISVLAGGSFDFVSRSLQASRSILKSYLAFGPCLGVKVSMSDKLDLGALVKLMFASYPHNEKFAYMSYQLFSDYCLFDSNGFKLSLFIPLDIAVKKDSCTAKVSVGMDMALKVIH